MPGLLVTTLLVEFMLLVKPYSLDLVEPDLTLQLKLLPQNCLRDDENYCLPMLFDLFLFENLFLLLEVTSCYEDESLPAKLLEAIVVVYKK